MAKKIVFEQDKVGTCKENSANIILITMTMLLLVGICGYFSYDLSAKKTATSPKTDISYQK